VDSYELAWAAGFFDGEGWANTTLMGRGDKKRPQARVNQAGTSGVPAALTRFQKAVGGLGRLGGPYRHEGREDLYSWTVSSKVDVQRLFELLRPWLCQPKLDQLTATQSIPRLAAGAVDRRDEWRAWAAGLYDGEGSTYLLEHRSHAGYSIAEARITQGSKSDVPEVLTRFRAIVATGSIYGPYFQEGARLPIYRWHCSIFADIDRMLSVIWPWLGDVKRSQGSVVRAVVNAQLPLPRGRPEWGNRKTHCVHGHEYATARIRPFVARGDGKLPRDSEQCLQCAREQARERRAQRKRIRDDINGGSVSEPAVNYYYLLK